jgi:tetratricopeptide (TPR) repeat protein
VVLLGRAVECCQHSTDLWLALAHLETYENARKVLNRARKAIPTERQVWIAAARLEETAGNAVNVKRIIQTGVESLRANMVEINRDHWLEDAEKCDQSGSVETCQAIVETVLDVGVDEEDRMDTWMEDADRCIKNGAYNCARAIFAHTLQSGNHKMDADLWLKVAFFEREHGTRESLEAHLQQAVQYCPKSETLWLMGAKSAWMGGDLDKAREILERAFAANKDSEEMWLAAVKLESENNEHELARNVLIRAREMANTPRVWVKSVRLEWVLGNLEAALSLVTEGIRLHATEAKLWMMHGQILDQQGHTDQAREIYGEGVKKLPQSVPLWLLAARLETRSGKLTRARAILARARTKNPKNDVLWMESVRVEQQAGSPQVADSLMAQAMQVGGNVDGVGGWWGNGGEKRRLQKGGAHVSSLVCRRLSHLCVRFNRMCPGPVCCGANTFSWFPSRKGEQKGARCSGALSGTFCVTHAHNQHPCPLISIDALKQCENSPLVLLAVAKLFLSERKVGSEALGIAQPLWDGDVTPFRFPFFFVDFKGATVVQQDNQARSRLWRCVGALLQV